MEVHPVTQEAKLGLRRVLYSCCLLFLLGAVRLHAQTAPSITGIAPNAMAPGKTITAVIKGTSLTSATAVTISGNGVTASAGTSGTATSLPVTITAAPDASLGSRTISVTTPSGTSSAFSSFTITNIPIPSLNALDNKFPGLSQALAPYQGSPFGITLTGQDFSAASQVTINGSPVATAFVNDTHLNATVPASVMSTTGNAEVAVQTATDLSGNLQADIIVNSGSTRVYSYQVTIRYDRSILTVHPENVTGGDGSGFTSKPTVINVDTPGTLILNHYTTGSPPSGTFTIAHVTFTPIGTGTSAVTLSPDPRETFVTDFGGDTISQATISLSTTSITSAPVSLSSNTLNLKIVERGDINGNRIGNIGDALVIALTVGGAVKSPPIPISVGDLNLNGAVNISDALVMALFSGRINPNLAAPSITAVSPASAARGDTLTITGTGFGTRSSDLQVVFTTTGNFTERVTPTLQSPASGDLQSTVMTVRVPDTAISGPIQTFRLDAPAGSAQVPISITGSPASLFLTSVAPFYQVAPLAAITLTGIGFGSTPASNTVLFRSADGTVPGTITQANSTSLTVTVPAAALCGAVTVSTGGNTSNPKPVMIAGTTCPLQVFRVLGGGTPGQVVTLEGTGFSATAASDNIVRFRSATGTVTAPVIQAGLTLLHVWVPDGAIDGDVTVTIGSTTSTPALYRTSSGPAQIVQVGTLPSSAVAGSQLALTVQVNNVSGIPLPGVSVSFSKTAGSGSISSPTALTDVNGRATVTLTLGTTAGTNTFEASVADVTSRVTVNVTGSSGSATQLVKISGDGQTGEAGTNLSNPFVVEARDQYGNVVPGASITFTSTGDASFNPAGAQSSGIDGRVQVNVTLGTAQGTQQFSAATLNATPVVFSALATRTASSISLVSGDGQVQTAGAQLPLPLKVKVVNVANLGVPGVTVAWSVTSGGGSVSSSQVVTNANGEAQITATLGSATGIHRFAASSGNLTGSPVSFTATAQSDTTAASVQLIKINDAQSGEAGTGLANPLIIEAHDQNGNPLSGVNVTFSVQNGGGSVSSAAAQTTGANGRVQVNATLGPSVGTQQFLATAPGAIPVLFSADAFLTPSRIEAVSGTGQTASVGLPLPLPLRVRVSNTAGIGVPGVTISWAATAGGGSVAPAQNTTGNTGEAEITATLGPAAGANTFTATAASLSPVSFSATAMAQVPASIIVVGTPPASAAAGSTSTLTFQVNDSLNRAIPGVMVSFAVTSGAGSVSLSNSQTGADGRASIVATLGGTVGPNRFEAIVASVSQHAVVQIQGVAGPAAQLAIISGNNQTGGIGTSLANPLVVAARDVFGNVVAGVSVTFASTTGGGSVNPATAQLTNTNGLVQAAATLGSSPGLNAYTASASGLNPITFTATGTSNPVAWYSFDTQVGVDSIGSNNGTAANVTQTSGIRGQAASFANGYIQLPAVSAFNLRAGDFTLSVFIKSTTGNTNWFSKSSGSTHRYGLGGTAAPTLSLSGGAEGSVAGSTNVFDGQWHHVAGVRRGNQIEVWVDGHLEGTGAVAPSFSAGADSGSFAIGRLGECCEAFNGLMDEAKIWPRALSAQEIGVESGLPAAPTLSSVSPGAGTQGSTIVVTLSGTGFVTGNTTVVVSGTGVVVSRVSVTSSISLQATLVLSGLPGSRTIAVASAGGLSNTLPIAINANALSSANAVNVSTPYGAPGQIGSVDGTGNAARFWQPRGMWGDGTSLYVACLDFTIRRINLATGAVSTFAGRAGTAGTADGIGTAARFGSMEGLWGDGANLYVADLSNHVIRKIVLATAAVSTIAGHAGVAGSADGIGTAALFNRPAGLWGNASSLFIADRSNAAIRSLNLATLAVTTIAGLPGSIGTTDGAGTDARFNDPYSLWGDGQRLYIADLSNNRIRVMDIASQQVSTLAGQSQGSVDGTGATARFYYPIGMWGDGVNLYVADQFNYAIRKIALATANVTTVAGQPGVAGIADGVAGAATFSRVVGVWGDGINIYVTDYDNYTIRKLEAPPTQLGMVSGNNQSGEAGAPLPNPLVVEVRNAAGNPVAGYPVTFAVGSGGGSVSVTGAQTTGSDGRAQVTATLGTPISNQTFIASAPALNPVIFTAVQLLTPAQIELVSGNNQTEMVGAPLNAPLKVRVRNVAGVPVPNVTVSWAATSGGGSVSPLQSQTDANGIAQTTATLGGNTGTNTFTATRATLSGSPVTFTAIATAPAPPTISSITPARGIAGFTTIVTLTGTHFVAGATAVSVSGTGVAVDSVNVLSTSLLTASLTINSAAALGLRNLTATSPNGTSNAVSFSIETVAVNSVQPSSGAVAGGTRIVVTGQNLDLVAGLDFGGVRLAGVTGTATSLQGFTLPHLQGTVSVGMVTSGQVRSTGLNFTYQNQTVGNSFVPRPGPSISRREGHALVRLNDGRVWMSGGKKADGTFAAETEIYNPTANSWSPGPALLTGRSGHTGTLLADGRVVVIGGAGTSGIALASVEIFDPSANTVRATGVMNAARTGHTSTLTIDGRILVAGGTDASGAILTSFEIYDPASEHFTQAGILSVARDSHSAALLADGRIAIIGGRTSSGLTASTDVITLGQTISVAGGPALNAARYGAARAVLLPGGQVLVAGGIGTAGTPLASAESVDFTQNNSTTMSLPAGVINHTTTLVGDGQVLVAGGMSSATVANSSAYLIDPSTQFTATIAFTPRRAFHEAVLLQDGRVLLAGGNFAGTAEETSATFEFVSSPGPNTPPALTLSPNPLTVNLNGNSILTVSLNPAPTDYGTISIAIGNSSMVTAPASILVSPGQRSVSFVVRGLAIGNTTMVATLGSNAASADIQVQAVASGSYQLTTGIVRVVSLVPNGLGSQTLTSGIVRISSTVPTALGSQTLTSGVVRVSSTVPTALGSQTLTSGIVRVSSLVPTALGSQTLTSGIVRVSSSVPSDVRTPQPAAEDRAPQPEAQRESAPGRETSVPALIVRSRLFVRRRSWEKVEEFEEEEV